MQKYSLLSTCQTLTSAAIAGFDYYVEWYCIYTTSFLDGKRTQQTTQIG